MPPPSAMRFYICWTVPEDSAKRIKSIVRGRFWRPLFFEETAPDDGLAAIFLPDAVQGLIQLFLLVIPDIIKEIHLTNLAVTELGSTDAEKPHGGTVPEFMKKLPGSFIDDLCGLRRLEKLHLMRNILKCVVADFNADHTGQKTGFAQSAGNGF